jgi:hypothetical protein
MPPGIVISSKARNLRFLLTSIVEMTARYVIIIAKSYTQGEKTGEKIMRQNFFRYHKVKNKSPGFAAPLIRGI